MKHITRATKDLCHKRREAERCLRHVCRDRDESDADRYRYELWTNLLLDLERNSGPRKKKKKKKKRQNHQPTQPIITSGRKATMMYHKTLLVRDIDNLDQEEILEQKEKRTLSPEKLRIRDGLRTKLKLLSSKKENEEDRHDIMESSGVHDLTIEHLQDVLKECETRMKLTPVSPYLVAASTRARRHRQLAEESERLRSFDLKIKRLDHEIDRLRKEKESEKRECEIEIKIRDHEVEAILRASAGATEYILLFILVSRTHKQHTHTHTHTHKIVQVPTTQNKTHRGKI